jgi:hypothetical protein
MVVKKSPSMDLFYLCKIQEDHVAIENGRGDNRAGQFGLGQVSLIF